MRAIVESPMGDEGSEDPDLVHVLVLYFESPIKEGIVDFSIVENYPEVPPWQSLDVR